MALLPLRSRPFLVPGVLAAIATGGLLIRPPVAWVERGYSNGLYPAVQRVVTATANVFPFPLSDWLLIGSVFAVLGWIALAIVQPRVHGWALFRRLFIFGSLLVISAGLMSGLNVRRAGLQQSPAFHRERVSHEALLALANRSVLELNTLYTQLPARWPDWNEMQEVMGPAFRDAHRSLGAEWTPALARPKYTVFDRFTRVIGVNGYFTPFFDEVVITKTLFPFERAYTLTHEWAHGAGRVNESEASYVGWLSCLRGPAWAQYSGWFRIYQYAAADLSNAEARMLYRKLDSGPRADLRASWMRGAKDYSPRVRRVSSAVEDKISAITRLPPERRQYGLVVQLILGLDRDTLR